MKFLLFIALFLSLLLHIHSKPLGKGWHIVQPEHEAPSTSFISENNPKTYSTESTTSLENPDFTHLEALAKGLKYDPLLIFEHILNHYDIQFYPGIVKGALQTYFDQAGNDWDLSILTAKLLELSKFHNQDIQKIEIIDALSAMSQKSVATWIACENDLTVIKNYLDLSRIFYIIKPGDKSIHIYRTYVKLRYNNQDYYLDVGFKEYEKQQIIDLEKAMQTNFSTLYAEAGGTEGSDWVSGLDHTAIHNYLNNRCADFFGYLQQHHTNDPFFDVLGGKRIKKQTDVSLPQHFRFPTPIHATYTLGNLPNDLLSKINFKYGAIDTIYLFHEIAGRKIALTYEANSASTSALTSNSDIQTQSTSQSIDNLLADNFEDNPNVEYADDPISNHQGPVVRAIALDTVDFKIQQQGNKDTLNGYQYRNPADAWQVRLESTILSGSNAFYPQYTTPKYHSKGDDLILAAYFKNSTLARGEYTGQIEHKLYWNDGNLPFQVIVHDLKGTVAETPNLSYSGTEVSTLVNIPKEFTVSLMNHRSLRVTLLSTEISGNDANNFSWVSGHGNQTINGNGTHPFKLNYSPTASGTHQAQLTISFNYDGLTYNNVSIPLKGYATLPALAKLYIDDVLVAQEPLGNIGKPNDALTVSIDHFGTSADQTADYTLKRGSTYIISADFGSNKAGLRLKHVQKKLNKTRLNFSDNTQAVLTDTLDVIGQTWMQQTAQINALYNKISQTKTIYLHLLGIIAQEEGYYIDIGHTLLNIQQLSSQQTEADITDSALFSGMLKSALEHGVLEQIQVNRPATSTAEIFGQVNLDNKRMYYMDADNYETVTKQHLNHYSSNTLSTINDLVHNENAFIILPQEGNITLGDWAGFAYFAYLKDESDIYKGAKYGIKGNWDTIHGGYGATRADINTEWVVDNFLPDQSDPAEVQHDLSPEPVDLTTGAYYYQHTDLSLGQSEPRGIHFSRTYNSLNADQDKGFGYGWDHNWNAYIKEYSEADYGLGMRHTFDAISQLVAGQTLFEIEKQASDNAKKWVLNSIIANWAADQLNNNALAVHIHGKVLVFNKLPDGSFVSPPGVTETLVKVSNGYELRGRFGTTHKFELVGDTHRLKTWTNADGQSLSLSYTNNRPSQVSDAYGRTLSINYNNSNRINKITDSTGRTLTYTYSANGDLTHFTDADGNTVRFKYDNEHQIIQFYDADNRLITENTYNDFGRVTRQMSEGSKEWNFYYSDYKMIEQDPTGAENTYEYDANNLRTAFTDAEGNRTAHSYNGQYQITQIIDPNGNRSEYSYDNFLNPIRFTQYLNETTPITRTYSYTPKHLLEKETDPLGHTTTHSYDDAYHRLSTTNALNEITRWTYTDKGEIQSETSPENQTTQFAYDSYGNPSQITHPDSTTESFTHNTRGQRTSHSDRQGNTTHYGHDKRGNLTSTTFPIQGMKSTATYNYSNQILSSTNPRGIVTQHSYSPLQKRTQTVEDYGGQAFTTRYTYDQRDFLTETTTPLGYSHRQTLDKAGRTVANISPLNHSTRQAYDANSNRISQSTPLNESTTFTYDTLNRLTHTTRPFSSAETIQRNYDHNGNLTRLRNARGKDYTMSYDGLNRIRTLTTPLGHSTQTTYTKRNQISTRTEPSQQTSTYTYDGLNRIHTLSDDTGTISYDHLDGNNDHTSSVTEQIGNSADNTQSITRTHDALKRVTQCTDSRNQSIGYSYDHNSNLTQITYPNNQSVQYSYNSRDQLQSITDWNNRKTTYHYDADGRLTRIDHANGTHSLVIYDANNRITQIKHNRSNGFLLALENYHYDPADKITTRFKLPKTKPKQISSMRLISPPPTITTTASPLGTARLSPTMPMAI